jgi:hypothetical protein
VLAARGVCVTWNNPDPSELIVKISPRVWLSLSHRRNTIFPIEAVPFEAAEMVAADAVGATDPTAVAAPPNVPSSAPSATITPSRLMATTPHSWPPHVAGAAHYSPTHRTGQSQRCRYFGQRPCVGTATGRNPGYADQTWTRHRPSS